MNPDVVDLYQLNANNSRGGDGADFAAAKAFGIRGVIHKASQYVTDSLYAVRKPKVLALGMLWGAYHFPTPTPVADQLALFFKSAPPDADTFPFLDYESYRGYTMSLQSAINFMDGVDQKYGRPCGLYSGNVIKEQVNGATPGQIEFLAAHPFWLAQYANVPQTVSYDRHPLPWTKDYLWQFTGDGAGPGPHYVPGIGNGVDVSTWAGDKATDLEMWWKTGKVSDALVSNADPGGEG